MSIASHIKRIVGDQVPVMIKGTVTSVDKGTDTMVLSPLDGGADYTGVFLEALDATSYGRSDIVRYPVVGAYAIIGLIENDATFTFLVIASKYDSALLNINSLVINGGKNNGLVNIAPLVAKMNKLETTLNQLLTSFKTHCHLGVTTGSGVSGLTETVTPASIAPLTKQADIEDTKIKH